VTGRLAFVSSGLSLIAAASHIPLYASSAVVPFTRSHSIAVEGLGVADLFVWTLFLTAVYDLLASRAGRLARWGLALGIAGTSYLCILNLLYVLEVVWFSDTFGLFVIGALAWLMGLGTVLYLSRTAPTRSQGLVITGTIPTLLGILAYPIWQVLLWRRISGKLVGEVRASTDPSPARGLVGDQERA
jgi:hypothetical protein